MRIERNQKVAGARNVGIAVSTGEYLTFLDDDDARLPGSLALQVEQLERCPDVGLSYGQAVYGDQLGRHTDRVYPRQGPEGDIFWNVCGSESLGNRSSHEREDKEGKQPHN